jgi:guanylate kinase
MVYEGKYYGTLASEIAGIWARGKTPLLDIDVKGAIHVKNHHTSNAFSIFIEPPSLEELGRRLRNRGTDSEESILARLEKSAYELSFKEQFDSVIMNDNLEKACRETAEAVARFIHT